MTPLRLVNLTPHDVAVIKADGVVLASFPASGTMARIIERAQTAPALVIGDVLVPVQRVEYADEVEGLPAEAAGSAYLVSRVLALAVQRPDLYFPADEVRDDTGRIIGCRNLGQFVKERT